jgi:hypothetical protein
VTALDALISRNVQGAEREAIARYAAQRTAVRMHNANSRSDRGADCLLFNVRMTPSSTLRITGRHRLICLTTVIVGLIVALVLAASAHAEDLAPGSEVVTAASQEPVAGQGQPEPAPAEPQASAPAEATPEGQGTLPAPPGESATAPAGEEPGASVAPEGASTPPPIESTPPEQSPGGQVAAPSEPEEHPAALVPEETTAPAEVTTETTQDGPLETPEETTGKTPLGERGESSGEASTSTSLHSAGLVDAPVAQLDVTRSDTGAPEAPVASGGVLPVIATIAGTEVERPPPGGGPTAPAHVAMSPAQSAGGFSCELSQLGGDLTDNCTVGWLGAPRFLLATSSSGLVTAASSLVAVTLAGSPSEGGHGSSSVSSPPVGPAPGPAPSGAAGAATGAGGVAPLSTFLTLAGLLLLGAPRVLRRLRLACEAWLAGCFVLIPERPD